MTGPWTGGQYSLVRALFGTYLAVHFAALLPWAGEVFSSEGMLPREASPLLHLFPNVLAVSDAPLTVVVLLCVALAASIALAIGFADRFAAVVVWYVLACLSGRNPLIANPSLPYVGWLLLMHAFVPPAPYLSWAARGRTDPRGNWRFPPSLYVAAWIVMSAGYSYSGWTKLISPSWVDGTAFSRVLTNPLARPTWIRDAMLLLPDALLRVATWGALVLELLFLPLAISRRARPVIWAAMLFMHLGLMVLIDFADLSFAMVVLHLFTFDPAWVRPAGGAERDDVFYDGTCGLCHRAVRFILAEDSTGGAFDFAPIGGDRFQQLLAGEPADLPDSVVVRTGGGAILVKSRAAGYVLRRLGGLWGVLGVLLRLVPTAVADLGYDVVAKLRYSIFGREKDACPLLPADLRARFLA